MSMTANNNNGIMEGKEDLVAMNHQHQHQHSTRALSSGVAFDFNTNVSNPALNSGDTSLMIFATALVLFQTMPGLSIYYAGMVNSKNVLSMAMQMFTITSVITILWLAFGYSLTFGPTKPGSQAQAQELGLYNNTAYTPYTYSTGTYYIYGDGSRLWLRGLTINSVHELAPTIPESVFCTFQLMFAIITAALICGSFADRMKYWSMVVLMVFFHLLIYIPIAHSIWHPDGWLYRLGALDFAGGNVVHISSGVAGLMTCFVIGNRKGWTPQTYDSHPPHSILLTFMGLCMLWVGWFGFNAGSAFNAGPVAGIAMLNTQIATSVAAISWMLTEVCYRSKPSVLGMLNGAISGLVVITPCAGYVDMNGAFFIGLIGGVSCYYGSFLKYSLFKVDDALHAFGVHSVGGVVGNILLGFFASTAVEEGSGGRGANGVFYSVNQGNAGAIQLGKQCIAVIFSIGWSGIISFVILKAIDLTLGLRVSTEAEEVGLDESLHGESMHGSVMVIEDGRKMLPTGEFVSETGELMAPVAPSGPIDELDSRRPLPVVPVNKPPPPVIPLMIGITSGRLEPVNQVEKPWADTLDE